VGGPEKRVTHVVSCRRSFIGFLCGVKQVTASLSYRILFRCTGDELGLRLNCGDQGINLQTIDGKYLQ
jgi:hypothetical protein